MARAEVVADEAHGDHSTVLGITEHQIGRRGMRLANLGPWAPGLPGSTPPAFWGLRDRSHASISTRSMPSPPFCGTRSPSPGCHIFLPVLSSTMQRLGMSVIMTSRWRDQFEHPVWPLESWFSPSRPVDTRLHWLSPLFGRGRQTPHCHHAELAEACERRPHQMQDAQDSLAAQQACQS